MASIAYHPSVSHYLKYVATTIGRDKVMRVLQYFARFYSWYLFRLNATKDELAPWNAIKTTFGLIRKSLRLGKAVEHIRLGAQAFDSKTGPGGMDPFLRFCAIGRQLGYAGYMTFDNIHFFHMTGMRVLKDGQRWQILAWRSWFVGILFNAIAGVYQSMQLRNRLGRVNRKDGEGVVQAKSIEREQFAVSLQLISDLCDLTVPTFGLGWGGNLLDEGIVGLAGTTSSLIGVWTVWQKTSA